MRGFWGVAALAIVSPARAADITFAIIGPHEYKFPVNFKPYNVFVQYGDGNAAGHTYDGGGTAQPTGGSHSWTGMSKYVYFRSFRNIPNIGFAFEIIQQSSYMLENGQNYGGLGTTIPGFATWFKPDKHSTFGIQTFMESPSATRDALASHYWTNISSLIFDYDRQSFSFDGDLGATAPVTDKRIPGKDTTTAGVSFFSNLRFTWKATKIVEPFAAFDWSNANGTYDRTLGHTLANSSSRETALGGGLSFKLDRHMTMAVRYSHSVDGRYVAETNAYYLRFSYLW